jgi:radical SAM superfamily enzyme YgiQ (UPF0313 family)
MSSYLKKYQSIIFTDLTDTVLTVKPMGAFKIAHEIRKAGFSCLVIDHLHQWEIDDILSLIDLTVSKETLFVGFSTTFFQNAEDIDGTMYKPYNLNSSIFPQGQEFEKNVIKKIKEINPNCKILAGGHKLNEQCSNRNVDIIVKGLAEISMVAIIKNLFNNQPLENSFKNLWGISVVHKDQEKEYNFAESGMVWEYSDVINSRVLPMEPARGCIFNCKYCSFPQRGKKTLDYVLTEELIYNELKNNYDKFGITTYQLLDDTFNDSDQKLERILGVVKQLNFQPIFWAYNRLDLCSLKPERVDIMFKIGLRATSFGIETLNGETGRLIGKGLSGEKQIQAVKNIRKKYGNNLLMHGLFIIGLPGESLKQIDTTFNLIVSQDFPLHSAYFEYLHISRPNTTWLQSDFDKNWQSSGYEDIGGDPGNFINWKNEFMTIDQAKEKKAEFMKILYTGDQFHVPGQTAWALMNYPMYDLEKIQNLKNNEVAWEETIIAKKKFFKEYKDKLLDHLNR